VDATAAVALPWQDEASGAGAQSQPERETTTACTRCAPTDETEKVDEGKANPSPAS
jgi:hypothetical protein